jgi:peptidoglycan/LPS O-acetylase OafA/YrhL
MSLKNDINYYPALTGLRSIAAYMVYFHHFNPIPEKYLNGYLRGIINEMHIGVTIFFVLSGFLITNRYYNKENFSFKTYFVNRIARIYPIYFFITTFTFFILLSKKDIFNDFLIYILNITFLRGFFENIKFSLISQGWSLTVEETFYLLAPLCFLLVKRKFYFLILIPIVFILLGIVLVNINMPNYELNTSSNTLNYISELLFSYGFFQSYDFMFNYTFFGRVCEFFAGMALAIFIFKKHYLKIPLTYLGAFVIMLSLVILYVLKKSYGLNLSIKHPLGIITNTLILPFLGIAPLLYGLIHEKTIVSKILGSKLFIVLGKSSFVFYLIHAGAIKERIPIIGNLNLNINLIFQFVVIQVVSILLFYSVEEPLNKKIRNLVKIK